MKRETQGCLKHVWAKGKSISINLTEYYVGNCVFGSWWDLACYTYSKCALYCTNHKRKKPWLYRKLFSTVNLFWSCWLALMLDCVHWARPNLLLLLNIFAPTVSLVNGCMHPIRLPLLCMEVTAGIQLFVKSPLKTHTGAFVLGYIKVISCQASPKHPLPSASKTADWSRHPVWHIWARESNENSCFCPYGIQRLAEWRSAVPTIGKLSIINPGIWPAYESLLIKTSGGGGIRRGTSHLKGLYFAAEGDASWLLKQKCWEILNAGACEIPAKLPDTRAREKAGLRVDSALGYWSLAVTATQIAVRTLSDIANNKRNSYKQTNASSKISELSPDYR